MALTPSHMVALGTAAPDFSLPDTVSGQTMSLSYFRSDMATVIMFICNHCPYVRHINAQLVSLAGDYMPRGIRFVAISSNDAAQQPDDGPDQMRQCAIALGYPFPYLYDETQSVARAYEAACTPDFYIYDPDFRLIYRGQLDDSRPGNQHPADGRDMRAALDAVLRAEAPSPYQRPSIGCNIKWK